MSLLPFCQWLAETPWSIALHESLYMYPLVESTHVISICLFVGMTIFWDLRLMGVLLPNVPMTEMDRRIWPFMMVGSVIMIVTGVLLFYAIPVRSYQNVFFRLKVIFLICAAFNVWLFNRTVYKTMGEWGKANLKPPRQARRAAVASLLLWAGIIVTGRMIAYNWFDCDMRQGPFISWVAGCTEKG